MSDKTMVTIDCDINILEGEEKVFENQHITLDATIEVTGSLIFRNCTIEQSIDSGKGKGKQKPWYVYTQSNGKLEMDGCEIIHPRTHFLHGYNMTIKNTSFLFAPHSDRPIFTMGKVQFEGCSFTEEPSETGNIPTTESVCCNDATFDNCIFQNIAEKISADTIIGCTFNDCSQIFSLRQIRSSTFEDCNQICIVPVNFGVRGSVTDCNFIRIGAFISNKGDMENCRFTELQNDSEGECVVSLTDCQVTQCSFENVLLRNNSYLIIGEGNISVEDCKFTNCQTDREDLQLIYIKQKKRFAKRLFKGALKLTSAAALGVTGVAATVLRAAGEASESDLLTNIAGMVQDASFEKARDMLGMDDTKKIDNMNLDELTAYVSELTDEMDDDERMSFYDALDDINGSELSESEREAQIRELVKEIVKARGRAKRAMDRAETSSQSANQFKQRYEKEKAKYEDAD